MSTTEQSSEPILSIQGLKTWFHTEDGIVKAVDGISLEAHAGETLGIVGESGSGKSVTSLTLMRLLPELTARVQAEEISFLGRDMRSIPKDEMCKVRGKDVAMIFQEPMTSLNPVLKIQTQMNEILIKHEGLTPEEATDKSIEMLKAVGIPEPERRIFNYPHEFSGGMRPHST